MEIRDCDEAMNALFEEGKRFRHGTVRTKDGTVYSGKLFDLEDPINDPEGVGYFLLMGEEGELVADISFNEFDALIDVW